ncbi:polymorphic toxin-type HINT domain-containing protein [Fodinicola feengrottensis]|uniref:polymorphic toxin-type HINT domain-containing protein n=1 Tax=Fodinicola feengrottensis TaxID=435914 RepID=UPI0013D8C751|nr:polymorphic toxin-type HINT domain-containing protein [Fodinicola feengrottensis]
MFEWFVAATMVLLAGGGLVSIAQVHVGDKVQTTDPSTGQSSAQTVTATIKTLTDSAFSDVTIKDSHGYVQTITSTQGHPYWDATREQQEEKLEYRAEDLKIVELIPYLRRNQGLFFPFRRI